MKSRSRNIKYIFSLLLIVFALNLFDKFMSKDKLSEKPKVNTMGFFSSSSCSEIKNEFGSAIQSRNAILIKNNSFKLVFVDHTSNCSNCFLQLKNSLSRELNLKNIALIDASFSDGSSLSKSELLSELKFGKCTSDVVTGVLLYDQRGYLRLKTNLMREGSLEIANLASSIKKLIPNQIY